LRLFASVCAICKGFKLWFKKATQNTKNKVTLGSTFLDSLRHILTQNYTFSHIQTHLDTQPAKNPSPKPKKREEQQTMPQKPAISFLPKTNFYKT
jgi:hypothetical protein